MSAVKHTPGPLHVENDHSIHTASGHPIGAAWPFEYDTPEGRHILSVSQDETAANATLWAAAPEMLFALRATLIYLPTDDSNQTAKDVRAAIAKATGGVA